MVLEIEFFETENGNSPVEKYIRSLENERMDHVLYQIQRLAKNGVLNMPAGMIKSVQGIYYLRVRDRKGIHRIFFTIEREKYCCCFMLLRKKTRN